MSDPAVRVTFDRARVLALLERLERMAGGDMTVELPLSGERDELDAIAHAVNVLSDELRWASARTAEAERRRVSEILKRNGNGSAAPG